MTYRPLPVVVKYIKPGLFDDTMYRSFSTIDDAKAWLKEPYDTVGGSPRYVTKASIHMMVVDEPCTHAFVGCNHPEQACKVCTNPVTQKCGLNGNPVQRLTCMRHVT